jgi:hypothetical protein
MHAPITATHFNAVWSAARSAGVPLPADSTINVEITWFTRAHLRRATSYKKVCDVAVRDGAVILQYNARDERVYGVRSRVSAGAYCAPFAREGVLYDVPQKRCAAS